MTFDAIASLAVMFFATVVSAAPGQIRLTSPSQISVLRVNGIHIPPVSVNQFPVGCSELRSTEDHNKIAAVDDSENPENYENISMHAGILGSVNVRSLLSNPKLLKVTVLCCSLCKKIQVHNDIWEFRKNFEPNHNFHAQSTIFIAHVARFWLARRSGIVDGDARGCPLDVRDRVRPDGGPGGVASRRVAISVRIYSWPVLLENQKGLRADQRHRLESFCQKTDRLATKFRRTENLEAHLSIKKLLAIISSINGGRVNDSEGLELNLGRQKPMVQIRPDHAAGAEHGDPNADHCPTRCRRGRPPPRATGGHPMASPSTTSRAP
ncbi:hypothetical protein FB451DRAFT_1170293 [Mycena latifolia]|nr:hypothetical protein FB451DRAFT_1170293 [Mycena latifolia]